MPAKLTKRRRIMLAALATEPGAQFAPVQVQKLFFLIDENLADEIGGKQFAFEPYDYGPFDQAVYHQLAILKHQGLANVERVEEPGRRRYSLTPLGQKDGESALQELPPPVRDYLADLSEWVRSLSFAQLVGSVYKAYPEMRENSIFQD